MFAPVGPLYDVFARYRLRSVRACQCCHDDDQVQALRAKPLRALLAGDFSCYPRCAMSLWGDEYDFKHFLPRLLELSLGQPGFFDLQDKLRQAAWPEWLRDERLAVAALVRHEAERKLRFGLERPSACLDDLYFVGEDPRPILERLLADATVPPRWYAELVLEAGQGMQSPAGLSASPSVYVDWLFEAPRADALERAFFAAETGEDQRLYSSALGVLEWFG